MQRRELLRVSGPAAALPLVGALTVEELALTARACRDAVERMRRNEI